MQTVAYALSMFFQVQRRETGSGKQDKDAPFGLGLSNSLELRLKV